MTEENKSKKDNQISRRDFIAYSAGVAAATAGAVLLGKEVLSPQQAKNPEAQSEPPVLSGEPIVVAVNGDELTIMRETSEVKIRDSVLAAAIAGKIE